MGGQRHPVGHGRAHGLGLRKHNVLHTQRNRIGEVPLKDLLRRAQVAIVLDVQQVVAEARPFLCLRLARCAASPPKGLSQRKHKHNCRKGKAAHSKGQNPLGFTAKQQQPTQCRRSHGEENCRCQAAAHTAAALTRQKVALRVLSHLRIELRQPRAQRPRQAIQRHKVIGGRVGQQHLIKEHCLVGSQRQAATTNRKALPGCNRIVHLAPHLHAAGQVNFHQPNSCQLHQRCQHAPLRRLAVHEVGHNARRQVRRGFSHIAIEQRARALAPIAKPGPGTRGQPGHAHKDGRRARGQRALRRCTERSGLGGHRLLKLRLPLRRSRRGRTRRQGHHHLPAGAIGGQIKVAVDHRAIRLYLAGTHGRTRVHNERVGSQAWRRHNLQRRTCSQRVIVGQHLKVNGLRILTHPHAPRHRIVQRNER